jgi:hypothetical protein
MLVFLLAMACTGEAGGASDDSGDDTGGGGGPNPDAPTILMLDVYCCNPAQGPIAWYWILDAQVSDPQGAETLAQAGSDSGNEVNVRGAAGGGGEPLAEYGAGFHCDDKGVCGTSWQQSTDNIICDGSASNYSIELIVADEDGNRSEPEEVLGEQREC